MADVFFLYNQEDGKCVGTTYDDHPPNSLQESVNYVKLPYEKINEMNSKFHLYRYLNGSFEKLIEVSFCVSPSNVYVLGTHNKISICLKASIDTTAEEILQLKSKTFKIKINNQEYDIGFEEIIMLEPEAAGAYMIELLNDDVACELNRYAISVIESSES